MTTVFASTPPGVRAWAFGNTMELSFRNTRDDYLAYAQCTWKRGEAYHKQRWFQDFWWHLLAAIVAGVVAVRAHDLVGMCVIGGWMLTYFGTNYSWRRDWNAWLDWYADECIEMASRLTVDSSGLTEQSLGLFQYVPWDRVTGFSRFGERTLVHFAKDRSFIVPDRDIGADASAGFVSILRERKVPEL